MTDEKWHGGPIVKEFGDEYFLRDDTEIRKGYLKEDFEGYSLFRREPYGRVQVFVGSLAWTLDQISITIKEDEELEKSELSE